MNKNREVAQEVLFLAKRVGWEMKEIHIASTGSIYIDLARNNEWIVIRVADHKQVYHHWMTTYSIAPGDLWFEELEEIITKPDGEVGDIM